VADIPRLFRVVLQVWDLDRAAAFYAELLGSKGRRIPGARHYFDCGSVIVALLDPTRGPTAARPAPEHVYFSVAGIEAIHARARELGCLSTEEVHGESSGEIVTRPWGERSFYAEDPFGNRLCFVDETTIFTGR
jgi:catechol 2,3-dioxygenase-like lactoylglutathione lyase family enzyme